MGQETRLLKTDAVFSTDAALHVTNEVHDESIDDCIQFGLQRGVVVAWDGDVQM